MEKHAYIYLLQDAKDKGTNIYKIGMTVQHGNDFRSIQRVKNYPQGTVLESTFRVPCEEVSFIEDEIKRYFSNKYDLIRGREWFAGDVQTMRNDINNIIDNSSKLISQDYRKQLKVIECYTEKDRKDVDNNTKQQNSTSFTCKRCHYTATQKLHLYRHLTRGKPCHANHSNASREELVDELHLKKYNTSVENKTKVCDICNAKFTNSSNLKRHQQMRHTNNIIKSMESDNEMGHPTHLL